MNLKMLEIQVGILFSVVFALAIAGQLSGYVNFNISRLH